MKPSLREWLDSRELAPPPALVARMRAEIERLGTGAAPATPKALADSGYAILRSLDEAGCSDRSSAVDLLAADALFTYAFELAAVSKSDMDEASRYVLGKVTRR